MIFRVAFTPGICVYDTGCEYGEVCIPPITEDWAKVVNEIGCDRYLECRNWEETGEACDYRFYGDIVGVECPLTAQPLQCVEPPPPGHCGSCKTNDDCYGGDVCLPSCATSTAQGPFVGADCSSWGICATDYDECR